MHGARGLLDAGLYAGVNPRVVVSVRGEKRSTPTQRNTSAPFWGGAAADGACWDFFCDDPTSVVHVVVQDVEGTGGYFVGQWITTVKHLVLAPTARGQASVYPYRAIANMAGSFGVDSAVSGTITFEQMTPLGDVRVTAIVSGLRPGLHGFHVHQYGDVRSTSDLSTMSAHFVPYCAPPDIDENGQQIGGCEDDQKHGLPPHITRQPGDMGNLDIGFDGAVKPESQILTIGQAKMSLADPLRSIVGRTVLIHSERDDGSQPYGNAGAPEAYGVIGIASAPAGAANAAQAPSVPTVTKVICTFEGGARSTTNLRICLGHPAGLGASTGGCGGINLCLLSKPDHPPSNRMSPVVATAPGRLE